MSCTTKRHRYQTWDDAVHHIAAKAHGGLCWEIRECECGGFHLFYRALRYVRR